MPPKMFQGEFLLLLLWMKNWRGLPVCSHRSETKTAKLSKSQMQTINQDDSPKCCPLAKQFGPARALHSTPNWFQATFEFRHPAGTAALGRQCEF